MADYPARGTTPWDLTLKAYLDTQVGRNVIVLESGQTTPPAGTPVGTVVYRRVAAP